VLEGEGKDGRRGVKNWREGNGHNNKEWKEASV